MTTKELLELPQAGEATRKKALRILAVIDDAEPNARGGRLVRLLDGLAPREVTSAVLSIGPFDCLVDDLHSMSIPVATLERPARRGLPGVRDALAGILGMRALIEKVDPDVVHLFGPRSLVWGRFAAAASRKPWVASPDPGDAIHGFRRMWASMKIPNSRGVILTEDADALENLAASIPIVDPVRFTGHGVDLKSAASGPVVPFELLPRSGFAVGLSVQNGATDDLFGMLEAFRMVATLRPDVRLVIFADRRDARLSPWEEDFGLSGKITCILPGREPTALLRRLDCLWVPGRRKPDPSMVLSAFAVGLPVVCGHQTGLAPHIRDVGGALMRDVQWPRQFAEATRDIIEDEGLRHALSRAGKIVAARFPWSAYLEKIRSIYVDCAEGRITSDV